MKRNGEYHTSKNVELTKEVQEEPLTSFYWGNSPCNLLLFFTDYANNPLAITAEN